MEGRKEGKEMKRKLYLIVPALVLAGMIALTVWAFAAEEKKEDWDVCCPMPNACVSWMQTNYPGAWGNK